MIKVTAITSGKNISTTRFRIQQYIEPLKKSGIAINEYSPLIDKHSGVREFPDNILAKALQKSLSAGWQSIKLMTRVSGLLASRMSDITWLQRELLPGYFTLESFFKKPLIFDVDDAIWLYKPFGETSIKKIGEMSEVIFAGNTYIADWFSKINNNIHIIPTAIDTSKYFYVPNKNKEFVIGWIGTSSGLKFFEDIEKGLSDFFNDFSDSKLLIVSDKYPDFRKINPDKIKYIPWSPETEISSIQSMNVGIMPLSDSEWSRGKCSFKMLQYMACGLPVVVSPVGMNLELIKKSDIGFAPKNNIEWYEALNHLYDNPDKCNDFGKNGRQIVEEEYSLEIISDKIQKIFKSLL